jgi:hypothetical protein
VVLGAHAAHGTTLFRFREQRGVGGYSSIAPRDKNKQHEDDDDDDEHDG